MLNLSFKLKIINFIFLILPISLFLLYVKINYDFLTDIPSKLKDLSDIKDAVVWLKGVIPCLGIATLTVALCDPFGANPRISITAETTGSETCLAATVVIVLGFLINSLIMLYNVYIEHNWILWSLNWHIQEVFNRIDIIVSYCIICNIIII